MDIKSYKLFFERIKLDSNGNISAVKTIRVAPTYKGKTQYNTIKSVGFDNNDNLKIS